MNDNVERIVNERRPHAEAGHADQIDPAQASGRGGDPQAIDCKFEGIEGVVLRAEFVRER